MFRGLVDEHPLSSDRVCADAFRIAEKARARGGIDRVQYGHRFTKRGRCHRRLVRAQPHARRVHEQGWGESGQFIQAAGPGGTEFTSERLRFCLRAVQDEDLALGLAKGIHERPRGSAGAEDDGAPAPDRCRAFEGAQSADPVRVGRE